MQKSFCPTDYGFEWTTDGWYSWDSKAGHKAALKARNAEAKTLKEQGLRVTTSSSKGMRTLGGIGSGHPHIDELVTWYCLEAY